MSYHFGYGQADWFYGKPKTEGESSNTPATAPSSAPPPPTGAPKPATPSPPATARPAPPMPVEEEEGGLNMMLIAGVGFLAITGVLIYFKFSGGSDEEVFEDIEETEPEAEAPPEPEKKQKTIKLEITTDDD